jgi:mannitol operon repressor
MPKELSRSEQIIALSQELNKETERGEVLLAAAYLDYLLGELIATKIVVAPEESKNLGLFEGPTAPLATFSARLRVAYAFGLLSKDEYDDINLIRDIRNKFAHQLTGLSFSADAIAVRCHRLISAKVDGEPSTIRECFSKASIRLMVDIILRIQSKSTTESQ